MGKVGVGIITCDRPDFYNKCLNSILPDWYDELVTVNDGEKLVERPSSGKYIKTSGCEGVGKAKNKAMSYLLNKGCDYIILVEDDMLFKDNLFKAYIEASKKTGIQHFMFGYHGPANKGGISGGAPTPKKIFDYGDVKLALNQHCVGAVTFYTRESLEDVGLHDESYTNAFEHVDHSYMLAKKGYSTPYWWWADLANSTDYVEEQACSENNSAIRPLDSWQENIKKSSQHFFNKHNKSPIDVPTRSLDQVTDFLKTKKNNPKISFIVHYREDTKERLVNLDIVYNYYKDIYPNSEFIFVEDDSKKTIENLIKPEDKYIFFENDGMYRKCEAYNIGFEASSSDIVCYLDIDCLISIDAILESVKLLKTFDMCIGYNKVALYCEYKLKNAIKHLKGNDLFNTISLNVDKDNIKNLYRTDLYTVGNVEAVGGCLFATRNTIKDINGFNPNFIGWGFEDNEIISRTNILNKKVVSLRPKTNIKGFLYHLPHEETYQVALTDKSQHDYYKHNHTEVSKVEAMEFNELKEYIKTW